MVRAGLAAITLLAAALGVQGLPKAPPILPGAYIVEYEDSHDTKSFIASVDDDDVRPRLDLNYKLFRGSSIQFNRLDRVEEKVAKIARMPAVKKVWPVKLYGVPEHTVHWVAGESSDEGSTGGIDRRQDGGNQTAGGNQTDHFSTHLMTQVNQLRDKGILGKGIKVGIVDTGTDYQHPALGGCFGPGCLVSFGEDLVGDNFNGSNTPTPDADPLDTCNGHGTHVAGIIAAQSNNPYGIIGAAQGVTLGSYRVFGCQGDVPDDVLISAYLKAYEAGADIITASIGGPSGWSEDPWALAVSRIVEAGVPCTVSAGNDGAQGLFYASTSSDGKRVTAIASVDNTVAPAFLSNATFSVNNGSGQDFGYTAGSPSNWTGVSLPLWAGSLNATDEADGCAPFGDSTPDLSGRIVLIRRGTCTFVQKATNAVRKGARYVMIYNNVGGSQTIEGTTPGLQAIAMATAEQGAAWIDTLKSGAEVRVTMTDPDTAPKFLVNFNNTATAGRPSTYTSWGPTFEADLKPQIATPGGLILSTYPRALGSYGVLSGTSMACPLAAAVYALIMDARGTRDPREIENLLSATASPTFFTDGLVTVPLLAPVAQQGAGLVRAYDAAFSTALLSVSSLSFNDSDHFAPEQTFSVTNRGDREVSYVLSNVGALTAYTYLNESVVQPDTFPNQLTDRYASLTFSPNGSVSVPPGQRRVVTVTAAPPEGLGPGRLPVYSGYVALNGSDGTLLTIPYQGVVGSLHSRTVLDASNTWLSRSLDRDSAPVAGNTSFALPPAGRANETAYFNTTDLPKLVTTLAMGSPLVRADLVAAGAGNSSSASNTTDVFGTQSLGQLANYPLEYQTRGVSETPWDGQLQDGSYAPAGDYKLVVRALHIFGDKNNGSEYDVTETKPFSIRYKGDSRRK